MFKTSDFFEILDYLKLRERYETILSDNEIEVGDPITQDVIDEVNLDEDLQFLINGLSVGSSTPAFFWTGDIALVTQTLADNEKITGLKLFENTLDQPVFSSDDYKRLRKFLIDWYAANRTLISTQKNISDLYSMPPSHMEELLRSFGYDINVDAMDQQTRAEFFKSLVSFYKKKGTIDTLTKALEFYGFIDADIIEYWLKKTEADTLVFSPERTRRTSGSFLIDYDMPYDVVTNGDPHWLATEQWIKDQNDLNKINLPSKSPYFSLVASFSIDYIKAILAVYQRYVHDQYDTWVSTSTLPNDVILRGLNITSSILEAHLAMLFVFESLHPEDYTTTDTNFYIYNVNPGTPFDLQQSKTVINQYVSMITHRPTDRDDRTDKLQTIWDDWTRPLTTQMLYGTDVATLLESIDPTIKAACQLEIDNGNAEEVLVNLISTVTNWIRLNISKDAPNLIVFLLGFNFNEDIKNIINFFKPYRARMVATDGTYVISDKLGDSVVLAEENLLRIYQTIIDEYDISDYVETEIIMDPFNEDHLCCLPPSYDGNTILQFDGNDNENNPFCFDNLFATDLFFHTIVQEAHDDLCGPDGRYPQDSFDWDMTSSGSSSSVVVSDAPLTTINSNPVDNLYYIEDTTTSSYLLEGSAVVFAEQTHGFGDFDGPFTFDAIPSYGSDIVNIYVIPGPYSILNDPNAYGTPQDDLFGGWNGSSAISSTYAIVGAYEEDDAGGFGSGKAYIYNVSNGSILHTIDNPNPYSTSLNDWFGFSVGISNSYSTIGAPYEDDGSGTSSGKAYIIDNSTGTVLHTLDNPNPVGTSTGDLFAYSVATTESYSLVGAFREDQPVQDSGLAYIYDNTTGNLLRTLVNPSTWATGFGDEFGNSVGICESYSIIGAPNEDNGTGSETGAAYIFDNSTGNLLHTLTNPVPYGTGSSTYFGNSVGISENYAIVGCHRQEDPNTQSGQAYIYSTATGALLYTLENPNFHGSPAFDHFGWDVSISDYFASVSTYYESDDSYASDVGITYIYSTTTGELIHIIENPNDYGTSNDRFGTSCAISNTHVIVTAPYEDQLGYTNSGKAYIFDLSQAPLWVNLTGTATASSATTSFISLDNQLYKDEIYGTVATFHIYTPMDAVNTTGSTVEDIKPIGGTYDGTVVGSNMVYPDYTDPWAQGCIYNTSVSESFGDGVSYPDLVGWTVQNNPGANIFSDWTFEILINPTNWNDGDVIWQFGNNYLELVSGNRIRFNGSLSITTPALTWVPGTWNYFAITHRNPVWNSITYMYWNSSTPVLITNCGVITTVNPVFHVGSMADGTSSFEGKIGHVSFLDVRIQDSKVQDRLDLIPA